MKALTYSTGEVELAYSEWDDEAPPLVCLHGITGSRLGALPGLVRGAQHAYAYDARGHGESGRTPSYSFADFGRDAVSFLRGVVREPAVLVGHSLGGMTAMYAAAHCPELVLGAFLIDPPLYAPEGRLRDERNPFTAVLDQAGKPVEELVAAGVPPERAQFISKLDRAVMAAMVDGSFGEGWDTDGFLRRIECPVVLEHGDRDLGSAIYPGELERAAPHLKHGRLLHMAGTGHVPWLQQEERFRSEVAAFLKEMSALSQA